MNWRGPLPDRSEDWDWEIDPDHVSAQGLVLLAGGRFPKSKLCFDSSLFRNDGTLGEFAWPNTPASGWRWNSWLNRFTIAFDGSDDGILFPTNPSFDTTIWTIAAWVKATAITSPTQFVTTRGTSGFDLEIEGDGRVSINFALESMWHTAYGPISLSAGKWYHICGSYSGSELICYIDGRPGIPTVYSGNPVVGDNVELGKRVTGAYPLGGHVADFILYNRALSPGEVESKADPVWTIDYGGMIFAERRWWPVLGPTGPGPSFKAAWAIRQRKTIGAGVI